VVTYGLIGFPLIHSWSADYFTHKFSREKITGRDYKLFPLPTIEEFPDLISREKTLAGLNVTIPYKQKVIAFLDELDPVAEEIGAVNTILVSRTGSRIKLKGFNTDADGFRLSADFTDHRKSLILGTGGAAKAVANVLKNLGIEFLFVSRSLSLRNQDIIRYPEINPDILNSHTLIVNTTPLGMFPDTNGLAPIPYEFLTPNHFLYDLVYNPEMTRFLQRGINKGTKIQNGLKMLQIQAELSLNIWESSLRNNFTPSGF
jgi:shikimate dehydrogenase